ncbi:MAG: helix-turn-helix domain-containing protein [Thermoanaerobaculia bacterium]|nr:helix-turn-helix domain-containing protein [Thermoanaerobaculia bacterium]
MSTKKSAALVTLETITGGPLTLGALLASIRMGEGLTQAELAAQLEISKSHLCDIEKGRKTVSPRRAARFAQILGYSEAQFVRLALQGLVEEAGLGFTVQVAALAS